MKYITPETFEEVVLKYGADRARIKEQVDAIENKTAKCQKEYLGRTSWWNTDAPANPCSGDINLYITRYYGKYWDSVKREMIKNNSIYFYPFCEHHHPKKHRKLTQKEIFYIKIC